MKIFKSIIAAAAVIGLGAVNTSCSDWLDYSPKDKQTYDQQFATQAGFHSTANGIYTQISGRNLYGYNLSYGPIDVMATMYNVPQSNRSLYEYYNGTWNGEVASAGLKSIWTDAYNSILNINVLLDALNEKSEGVLIPDDQKLMKGEMLALRAMIHLDLVRLFGPRYNSPTGLTVPYAETSEIISRDRLPLNEIIHDYIIRDLNEAEKLLKDVDPVLTEGVQVGDGGDEGNWWRYRQLRMNYYAVCLLKARAYIWMNEKSEAMAEALKITDDSKAQSAFPWVDPARLLGNGTNPDRIFSTECLFGFYNNSLSSIFDYTFVGSLDAAVLLSPRRGYLDILFVNSGDYRRQSQWAASASSSSEFDFTKYKGFRVNSDNPEFWGSFFGLMRKSEAYLIVAEALLDTDKTAALTYLNQVRQARGVEGMDASASNADVLKQIKFEYLRDMRGEGQIYFMFKRFRQVFGQYYGGDNQFDGGGASMDFEEPSTNTRYSVPVPADETY